jgi:hypothetical protein
VSTDQTQYMRDFARSIKPLSPSPASTVAPTYLALDAGRPGAPNLTPVEIARVWRVLHEVKPCQRALLRYAFPGGDRRNGPVAVFFRIVREENGYSGGHVFGSNNAVYMWDGQVIATMGLESDAEAIAQEKCE